MVGCAPIRTAIRMSEITMMGSLLLLEQLSDGARPASIGVKGLRQGVKI